MKRTPFIICLLVISTYFGCKCDCPSGDLNSIFFAFRIGSSATSFTEAEVDTIVLYKLTKSTEKKVDSVNIYSKKFTLSETGLYFNGGSYWENDYLVKTQGNKEFKITDIQIESAQDKSRCKCFVNINKKLNVDNMAIDLTGKLWNDSNVELTR